MISVGLIGLGEIGQYHLAALRSSPDARLEAVCDRDEELARRSADGAAVYGDVAEMLARERLDAIDVCLPHALHLPVALAGLRAGCHVMLEKPMAVGVGACEEIERAAEQAGRLVGVSHNQLFYGPHVRLAELLDSGALGRLRALRARLGIGGKYGAWRADPAIAGGGLLIDAGVHRVYMMRRLGGRVRALQAAMDSPRAEDAFVVTLEFESGAIGVIDAAYHGPQGVFDDRIEAFCEDGLAEVAGCEAFFEGYLSEGPKLRVFTDGRWRDDPVDGSWDASVSASVHSMVGSLARGERPVVDAVDGKETVAIVEAAYRAAETGERVELASVLGIGDPVP